LRHVLENDKGARDLLMIYADHRTTFATVMALVRSLKPTGVERFSLCVREADRNEEIVHVLTSTVGQIRSHARPNGSNGG